MVNSASNRKYFDTTLVWITSSDSLVSSGIDYSVVGSRPSLLLLKASEIIYATHSTMALHFDDILRQVGHFSRFQHIQWFLLFLSTITQAWYSYLPFFTAAKVKNEDVICASNANITGCNVNCSSVKYDVDYTSIVTEVS